MRRLAWAAAAGVAVLTLGLLLAGWRPVALLSDSMAPAAPAGSLLVVRPVAPQLVEVGDVVTVPVAGAGRVTHRVVALEELEGETWARLQGDANDLPDPGRVALPTPTLRTVVVVPALGRLLAGEAVLLLAGTGLLLLGGVGLARLARRREPAPAPSALREVADTPAVDPRVSALLATLEAFAADGMDPATLQALGRVRLGALLGLGPVEHSPEVAPLDDGARFVVLALADADPAALAVVPPTSSRARVARAAVAAWWARLGDRVPPSARSQLTAVLTDAAQEGGIRAPGPVD